MNPENNFIPDGIEEEEILIVEEEAPDKKALLSALIRSFILTLAFIAVTAISNIIWSLAAGNPVQDVLKLGSAPAYIRAISRAAIFVLCAVICKKRGIFSQSFHPEWKTMPMAIVLGAALQIVLLFLLNPQVFWEEIRLGMRPDFSDSSVLQYFIVSVIFSPLAEELLFRGVIYKDMRSVSGRSAIVPAIISSLLFAMSHSPIILMVAAFISGLFFAYLTERTGSVMPAVVAHAVFNLMSYFIGYFPFSGMLEKTALFALALILLVLSVVIFKGYTNKKEN